MWLPRPGHKRHRGFILAVAPESLALGKAGCQVWALKQPYGKVHVVRNWSLHQPTWGSHLKSGPPAPTKTSDDGSPGQNPDCYVLGVWARTSQWSHYQIPHPQKLWDNKCFMVFKLRNFGIICVTSINKRDTYIFSEPTIAELQFNRIMVPIQWMIAIT